MKDPNDPFEDALKKAILLLSLILGNVIYTSCSYEVYNAPVLNIERY